jgi:hypothetical protein
MIVEVCQGLRLIPNHSEFAINRYFMRPIHLVVEHGWKPMQRHIRQIVYTPSR